MIIIGYQGETNAREHRFDKSDYLEKWPDATPDLVVTRPDGGQAYLANTVIDGNTLIWQINAYDTQIKGRGQAQLIFRKTVDEEVVVLGKSEVMDVNIQTSIPGTEGAEIPDPYETWVEQLEEYRSDTVNAADDASGSAADAAISASDAGDYAHNASVSADGASESEQNAEAWTVGTKNGVPVGPSAPQYGNNAKTYAVTAGQSVSQAARYEAGAAGQALVSEGYATGKQNGTDVESGTYYHNNSKYYAEQAAQSADAAETAAQQVTELTAEAETLQPGASATAAYDAETGVLTLGIPQGVKGDDGAPGQSGQDGADGTTFTPSVAANGDISWTNDGGKQNPQTVNIKGPQGSPGQNGQDGADGYSPTASVSKSGNTATISITDKNGTTTATVTDGTNGQDGQDGANGTDGVTFTPAVSADGVLSWTNDGGRQNPQSVDIAAAVRGSMDVEVTGTTPSITANENYRYLCGQVTTLSFTPCASGICDVIFTSGSTPTVLTVTPPTGMTMKWPAWFDPTSLEANTTYEINILDGVYGAVMAWT